MQLRQGSMPLSQQYYLRSICTNGKVRNRMAKRSVQQQHQQPSQAFLLRRKQNRNLKKYKKIVTGSTIVLKKDFTAYITNIRCHFYQQNGMASLKNSKRIKQRRFPCKNIQLRVYSLIMKGLVINKRNPTSIDYRYKLFKNQYCLAN